MSEKRYLFLADDNRIKNQSVWRSSHFEDSIPFEHLNAHTRNELLRQAETLALNGNLVYLVTDADFAFESERRYGGGRLAREFLKDRSTNCRAVIYSDEPFPDIGHENDPRVWAAKKNHAPDQILTFLISGIRPQIPECLDFLRRVATFRQALDIGIDRPTEAMDRIIEVLSEGFGESVPLPFSKRTAAFFDNSVATFVKNRRTSSESEAASEWGLILEILHPYSTLALAASDAFSPGSSHGGNFFALWQLSKCRRQPDSISSDLEIDEYDFLPREREWIRRQRRKFRARLIHLLPTNSSQAHWLTLLKAARSDLIAIENLLAEVDEA